MLQSKVDFSAQFGGPDAAAAVLPHFKALKAAARSVHLTGFPFKELAFILRVDGDVSQYGLSGSGNIDVDNDGEYLSVDIGITREDRGRLSDVIGAAILSSVDEISAVWDGHVVDIDCEYLRRCLIHLVSRYKNEMECYDPVAIKRAKS